MVFEVDRRALLLASAAGGVGSAFARTRITSADFGTKGDGSEADAAALQRAYDAVANAGGGTLYIPRGTYRCALKMTARTVMIEGEGRGVTILTPLTTREPILRLQSASPNWCSIVVSDLSLSGNPKDMSVGLALGHETYQNDDEYIGRLNVRRVDFQNLTRCISRNFGNLGLLVEDCTFGTAEYHLWSKSFVGNGREMHGGCVAVMGSQFMGFQKAMAYFESGDTLSGQVTFDHCIFESGTGFVFYVRGFRCVGGLPSIAVRNCWNEDTASGKSVIIEGRPAVAARFLFAEKTAAPIFFDDTPIGSIELHASSVNTSRCALDNLSNAQIDAKSSLTHEHARQASGTAPGLCRSVDGPTGISGLHTPWFRMPLPIARNRAYSANLRYISTGNTEIEFSGNRTLLTKTIQGDAALPLADRCQEISLRAGDRLQSPKFTTGGGRWYVTVYVFRMVSGGPVRIFGTGVHGFTGHTDLSGASWQCRINLSYDENPAADGQYIAHECDTAATLRIGGLSVMSFANHQEAIGYINDRLFAM